MARDLEYEMSDEASGVFEAYMERRMTMPYFSNARTVRNAMDRARMNSAIRTFKEATGEGGDGMVSVKQLKTIDAPDLQIMLDEINNADDDAIFA